MLNDFFQVISVLSFYHAGAPSNSRPLVGVKQDEIWLQSGRQNLSYSITAPFLVLSEHAESKLPFKRFRMGIYSHSLFLKSLAYIHVCIYMYTHIHAHMWKLYICNITFILQQNLEWNVFSPFVRLPSLTTFLCPCLYYHLSQLYLTWHSLHLGTLWSRA